MLMLLPETTIYSLIIYALGPIGPFPCLPPDEASFFKITQRRASCL